MLPLIANVVYDFFIQNLFLFSEWSLVLLTYARYRVRMQKLVYKSMSELRGELLWRKDSN